jgi:hypothetical protein
MDWLVHFAQKSGVKRLFGKKKIGDQRMDPDVRESLSERLLGQVDRLEKITGKDLSVWRQDE